MLLEYHNAKSSRYLFTKAYKHPHPKYPNSTSLVQSQSLRSNDCKVDQPSKRLPSPQWSPPDFLALEWLFVSITSLQPRRFQDYNTEQILDIVKLAHHKVYVDPSYIQVVIYHQGLWWSTMVASAWYTNMYVHICCCRYTNMNVRVWRCIPVSQSPSLKEVIWSPRLVMIFATCILIVLLSYAIR